MPDSHRGVLLCTSVLEKTMLKRAFVLAALCGSVFPAFALAKVTVALKNSTGATLATASFSDGSTINVTDSTFSITASTAANVVRVDVTGATAGAYSGPISISLTASGSTPTTVVVSSIGDCGGLSGSSNRPLTLSLSMTGNVTGPISVDALSAAQVGGALASAFTIGAGNGASPEFGSVSSAGTLNVVTGSLNTLAVLGSSDGLILVQDGTITTLRLGTPSAAGRLGGSVIVSSSGGSLGRIESVVPDISGPAPLIGGSVVSGEPTTEAKIWAKNGIGRINGSKIYCDVRANGGFTYTPPSGSATTISYTDGSLKKLQSSSTSGWFKGKIVASNFDGPGGSENPGITVTGAFDGQIKLGAIKSMSPPTVISVGSVPTDPSGGAWLDLSDSSIPDGFNSGTSKGVIIGHVQIKATDSGGRLGSIKARAMVPPGTSAASSSYADIPEITADGPIGRVSIARAAGDSATTVVDGNSHVAGACWAYIRAGASGSSPKYALDGLDVDGVFAGFVHCLNVGDCTLKGGIAGSTGVDYSVLRVDKGVDDGKVFRTKSFLYSSSGDQFIINQATPGSQGVIIYNADMSQSSSNRYGWSQGLRVDGTELFGRSSSSSGSADEFNVNHVAGTFGYTGTGANNIRGYTAGAAPFAAMRLDSYPAYDGTAFPGLDITTFIDGTKPVRLRYSGPVTLPSTLGIIIEEQTTASGGSWVDATSKFSIALGGSTPTREVVIGPASNACSVFLSGSNRYRVRYNGTSSQRPQCDKLLTSSAVPVAERTDYGTTTETGSATPVQFTFRLVACNAADVGQAGGVRGPDCTLDNNDWIAFITLFMTGDPAADVGSTGGVEGPDGLFDNNDFIAFASIFFEAACADGCHGPIPSCFGYGAGQGYVGYDPGEGEGESMMSGPTDPYAALRAYLQGQISTLPAGAERDTLIEWLNALPAPGTDDR
ncbi:MAG: hypothetical protein K2Q09_01015 [Phycisphaerales bacterium]|nr:hypothetical protein [Phycisphaerales bacterium]